MSSHPTEFQGSVIDALREAIERQIPDSRAEVNGGGGHYTIEVTSPAFAGKNMLQSQRLVYSAITYLMKGDMAPVHAVDSLKTRTPCAKIALRIIEDTRNLAVQTTDHNQQQHAPGALPSWPSTPRSCPEIVDATDHAAGKQPFYPRHE